MNFTTDHITDESLSDLLDAVANLYEFSTPGTEIRFIMKSIINKSYDLLARDLQDERKVYVICKIIEEWTEVRCSDNSFNLAIELIQFVDVSLLLWEKDFINMSIPRYMKLRKECVVICDSIYRLVAMSNHDDADDDIKRAARIVKKKAITKGVLSQARVIFLNTLR
jgi:hypothetical protein